MTDWKSKKDGKHFPISEGQGVPTLDDEIERIMAEEQKPIGIENMTVDEAKVAMDNLNNRYLGSVKTNGIEFHEWYSDFSGQYTWAVSDGDKIAFGGESKSGMIEANEGSATEAQLDQPPAEPAPAPESTEPMTEEEQRLYEAEKGDELLAGPSFVDSRDKDFMKRREKDAKRRAESGQ